MRRTSPFREAIRVAAGSLRGSKLRSFLTLLGIILSTTTLIAVMAVIHGMDVYIAQNVSDMGADGFRVVRMAFIGEWDPKKFLEYQKKNPQLSRDEYEFVRQRATMLREIGMEVSRRAPVHYQGERSSEVNLQGVSANIGSISNIQTAQGRFLTDSENSKHLNAAFIGNDLKEKFFPNIDPVGKPITIAGRPFTVVGVAKAQGNVFGQSRDNFAMIPIETYFRMFGARMGIRYNAVALDHSYHLRAQDEVRMLLRAYRRLGPRATDTFAIVSSDSLSSAWDRMTGAIAATAVAVVSVFMVVGGVVIMNIMLAVVTERTHEIGIRKSLGARRADILNQFLVESSMLSGSGGVAGVLIAWVITVVVRNATPIPMAMPASAILVGVGLSCAVGLFFGIYPARRASMLDPIEALRVER
ncbi:MAG: ABC transporter permease [Acidobacteria bacterium]|nr:ABC transporter permease [Acidobacteriota bacterium]